MRKEGCCSLWSEAADTGVRRRNGEDSRHGPPRNTESISLFIRLVNHFIRFLFALTLPVLSLPHASANCHPRRRVCLLSAGTVPSMGGGTRCASPSDFPSIWRRLRWPPRRLQRLRRTQLLKKNLLLLPVRLPCPMPRNPRIT